MADFGELEIGLYSNNANSYLVYLRYQPPGSGSGLQTATGTAVFPQEALLEKRANLEEYGRELAKNLFADQTVNSLFCDALKQANLNNQFLHVRLMIDQRLPELQVLLWETLRSRTWLRRVPASSKISLRTVPVPSRLRKNSSPPPRLHAGSMPPSVETCHLPSAVLGNGRT